MMRLSQIKLYYDTLKHLKASQVFYRSKHVLQYRLYPALSRGLDLKYEEAASRVKPLRRSGGLVFFEGMKQVDGSILERYQYSLHDADSILNGVFRFLNEEKILVRDIQWNDRGTRKLWLYNLHYMEYLIPLALAFIKTGNPAYVDHIKRLMTDWMDHNPIGMGNGWEPYPISLRIVSWIKVYELIGGTLEQDTEFCRAMMGSLFKQAAFLNHNLEFHLGANHLMENIKALIYSGLFFDNRYSTIWLTKGLRWLNQEVPEQFMPDGGHYERSTMYHLIMLEGITEIYILLRNNRIPVSAAMEDRIRKAYLYAISMLHPDGEISLFNDSALGIAARPKELLPVGGLLFDLKEVKRTFRCGSLKSFLLTGKHADWSGEDDSGCSRHEEYPDTGYFIIQTSDAKMIIDCGRLGPDYNPAHAHADLLSYELSVGGRRWIVDSGTYEYAGGNRAKYRATDAHNTVKIDGIDQSELWSTFRVARRAYPQLITFNLVNGKSVFSGSHDGYMRLNEPVIHTRTIVHQNQIFVVLDRFEGQGEHLFENFIHLHPDLCVERKENYILTSTVDRWACIVPFQSDNMTVRKSHYSDQFGFERENQQMVIKDRMHVPGYQGYVIYYADSKIEEVSLTVTADEKRATVRLVVNGEAKPDLELDATGMNRVRLRGEPT